MTTQALERLGCLEQWFRDYATSFATRLYASDFRERADELASIRQSLAAWGGEQPFGYINSFDARYLTEQITSVARINIKKAGTKRDVPLYTHPKPAQVDEAMVARFANSFYRRGATYEPERIAAALTAALQPEPRGTAQGGENSHD